MNKVKQWRISEKRIRLFFWHAGGSESRLQLSHFTLRQICGRTTEAEEKWQRGKGKLKKNHRIGDFDVIVLVLLFVFFFFTEHRYENDIPEGRDGCMSSMISEIL